MTHSARIFVEPLSREQIVLPWGLLSSIKSLTLLYSRPVDMLLNAVSERTFKAKVLRLCTPRRLPLLLCVSCFITWSNLVRRRFRPLPLLDTWSNQMLAE